MSRKIIEKEVLENELVLTIEKETLTDNSIVYNIHVLIQTENGYHIFATNSQCTTLREVTEKFEEIKEVFRYLEIDLEVHGM